MPLRSLVGGAIGCLNSLPHLTQQQPKQRQQRHEHFRDLPRYDDLASAASCSHSSWSECDGHCRTSDHSHADHPPLWAAHTGGARGGLPPHRPCDSVDQLPSYAESTFEATEALDLVWSKYTLGSKIAVHNCATGELLFSSRIEFFVPNLDINNVHVTDSSGGVKLRLHSGGLQPLPSNGRSTAGVAGTDAHHVLDIVQACTRDEFRLVSPLSEQLALPLMSVQTTGKNKHEAHVQVSPLLTGFSHWHVKWHADTKSWLVTEPDQKRRVLARISRPQGLLRRTAAIRVMGGGNYMYVVAVALVLFEREYILGTAAEPRPLSAPAARPGRSQ